MQHGALVAFCNLLSTDDPQTLVVVLDGINSILKIEATNENDLLVLTTQIEKCGGLDKIEQLQNHPDDEIYKLAFEVIDHYFLEEVSVSEFFFKLAKIFFFCWKNYIEF